MQPVIRGRPMLQHEGIVRRYAVGLTMETAPSYRRSPDLDAGAKTFPGILVRSLTQSHRTGAAALQHAVALLTGRHVAAPSVVTAAAMCRHALRHLPGFRVELFWEQDAQVLLAQCLGIVTAGGLVLLQWQALPREEHGTLRLPCPPAHWVLVTGVEAPWQVGRMNALTETEASALLVLDATVPPVWGSGHNLHLKPGAHPDHAEARRVGLFRPMWTARTLDGGIGGGMVLAAIVLRPDSSHAARNS